MGALRTAKRQLTKEEIKKSSEIRKKKKLAKGVIPRGEKPDKQAFDAMIRDFVSMHYKTNGTYKGNVAVMTRGIKHLEGGNEPEPSDKMKRVGVRRPEELAEWISSLAFAPHNGYFMSANSFTSYKAQQKDLFIFHNIVMDLDCHNWQEFDIKEKKNRWRTYGELRHAMESFVFSLCEELAQEYGIPAPNTAVYTGRGIQLWWALEPASYKCEKMYKRSARYIADAIEKILVDHFDVFGFLSLDRTASLNAAGMFRMPMTLNQKNGVYGSIERIHSRRIDLQAFWAEVHEDACRPAAAAKRKADGYDPKEIADFRRKVIIPFINMRVQDGCTMEGSRDIILFCLYNSMIHGYPDDVVMSEVFRVNRMFPKPLPEHEIENNLSTSRRKAETGNPYQLTNAYIIDQLGMLPEEQEVLHFYQAGDGRKSLEEQEKERAEAREKKEARDAQILSLAGKGLDKKEIAGAVGCSASTVATVLKKNKVKTADEKTFLSICRAVVKGTPLKKIAEKFGRSIRNIQKIAKDIREKGYKAVVAKVTGKKKKKTAKPQTTENDVKAVEATGGNEPTSQPSNNSQQAKKTPASDENYWEYELDQYNINSWARGSSIVQYFRRRNGKVQADTCNDVPPAPDEAYWESLFRRLGDRWQDSAEDAFVGAALA